MPLRDIPVLSLRRTTMPRITKNRQRVLLPRDTNKLTPLFLCRMRWPPQSTAMIKRDLNVTLKEASWTRSHRLLAHGQLLLMACPLQYEDRWHDGGKYGRRTLSMLDYPSPQRLCAICAVLDRNATTNEPTTGTSASPTAVDMDGVLCLFIHATFLPLLSEGHHQSISDLNGVDL
jgi:hypothetical protein